MKLIEPVKIGSMQLPNRIIMAPLTRCRADNEERMPTELHAEYYRQRAGAGLIITEGTVVSAQGIGYINTPGLYSEVQAKAWKQVCQEVHQEGGRIFAQLWHVGRISHPDFHGGKLPVAPSSINPETVIKTPLGRKPTVSPRELTIQDIAQIVNNFQSAALRAKVAGFDGVEIHSSNGYLFHQFFSNSSNKRTDQYGGAPENRSRFLFEVLDAVGNVLPFHRIGARLNPMLHDKTGIFLDKDTLQMFEYITDRLNAYNLAYLHLSRPFFPVTSPYLIKDVPAHFRAIFKGHLMVNGGYDKESAEHVLADGNADSVCFGRPFIANPDLPERVANDHPWATPDPVIFYTQGAEGYTTYPRFSE